MLEQKQNMSNGVKKTIGVLFISVVILAVFIGGIGIFTDAIYKKRARMNNTKREIRMMEERQKNVKALEERLAIVKERRRAIENVFVDERSVVRVIESLEDTADEVGVALEIESASLPRGSTENAPEFQLRIKGSFPALYRYIQLLEQMPFQIIFTGVHFNKSGSKETEDSWSSAVRFTLVSFLNR